MPSRESGFSRDDLLRIRLEKALKSDLNLSGYDINVRVVNGQVTLQGIVDVLADKDHAHRVAAAVEGAGEIENGITVSTDGAITDEDVYREIRQELEGNPHLNDMRVKVAVHEGIVTLTGTAESAGQKQGARDTVAKARGVKEIRNNLSVKTAENLDDASIVSEIQRVFIAEGIAGTIKVAARKGVATLSGSAAVGERNRAIQAALRVPGVKEVVAHPVDTSEGELSRAAARAAEEVRTAFAADRALGGLPLSVYEREGRLVLEGTVADLEQKRQADRMLDSLLEEFGREFTAVENKIRLAD
jgi:hyperosmotically inducible protein